MEAQILEFPQPVRSTTEIWADLAPLRMTGPDDMTRRQELIAELNEALNPNLF